jgi:hypothetical protein
MIKQQSGSVDSKKIKKNSSQEKIYYARAVGGTQHFALAPLSWPEKFLLAWPEFLAWQIFFTTAPVTFVPRILTWRLHLSARGAQTFPFG